MIAALSILAFIFIVFYLRSKYKKKLDDKMQEMEEKKGYFEHFEEKEIENNHNKSAEK